MTYDVLREAVCAVRETSVDAPAAADDTRAWVLATLVERRKRRLELLKFILPIAAVLIASTSWAATSGKLRRVADVLRLREPAAAPSAPAPAVATAKVRRAAASAAAAAVDVPPAPPQEEEAPAVARAPTSAPNVGDEADRAQALYAAAHRAHFVDRSWSAALVGWDRYLAAASRGRFATEARYNRALCLLRLGRRSEAKIALEPFASGRFGRYRQTDARALLDALEGRDP
jgi:hypothetical protein